MALLKGEWHVWWNERDNCVDIDHDNLPVDAFNQIGWQEHNLNADSPEYVPPKVRKYAEALWLTRGKDEAFP